MGEFCHSFVDFIHLINKMPHFPGLLQIWFFIYDAITYLPVMFLIQPRQRVARGERTKVRLCGAVVSTAGCQSTGPAFDHRSHLAQRWRCLARFDSQRDLSRRFDHDRCSVDESRENVRREGV